LPCNQNKIKVMKTEYKRWELTELETIEQDWNGDELKIKEDGYRVWLTHRQNRLYDGDYTVEIRINGRWDQKSYCFN